MDHPLELYIVIASAEEAPLHARPEVELPTIRSFYPVSVRLTRTSQPKVLTASSRVLADELWAVVLEWEASLPQAAPVVRAAQDAATGRKLSDLLFTDELDYLFAVAREDLLATPGELLNVKLEVEPSEAQRAPWELLLLRFAERGLPAGVPTNRVNFLRYSWAPARPLDTPFSLPINALVVTPGPWFDLSPEHDFDLRAMLEAEFPYHKDTLPVKGLAARRVQVDSLPGFFQAVDRGSVDILHLVLPAKRDARGRGVLRVGPDQSADWVSASVLDGLLYEVGTRLLVLHDPTPDGSAAPALWQVAGQIIRAGGPPTLVARFPHAPQAAVYRFFEVLYGDIIHAQGISVSYCRVILEALYGPAARGWPAFFSREGGEETLHLSQILDRLVAEAKEQEESVAELATTSVALWGQWFFLPEPPGTEEYLYDDVPSLPKSMMLAVEDARKETGDYAEHIRTLSIDYSGESRGLLPLASELETVRRMRAIRSEAEAATRSLRGRVEEETARRQVRYLNTRFTRSRPEPGSPGPEDDPVPPESTLKYGRTYYLAVDIRSDRSGSHAVDEIEWPDTQLPDKELAEAQGGRSLRVALFSRDFTLEEDQKPLWLPLYGPSERLYFQVVAPRRLGPAQIRVCVYYKNNLVQSRMVYAQVGRSERKDAERGNWSEVEYTLSATFGDLDRLRPRGLNIVFNEDGDGTHALLVRGDGLKDNVFDLSDEMTLAVTEFRDALNHIMFEDGSEVYRLNRRRDEPNWGTDATITADLRRLAHVGRKWYRDLFGAEKLELAETLSERLEEPTTIQVVRAKGKHIFPWSVIYDLPLVRKKTNQVCLEFRRHVTPQDTLDYASCKAACPHLNRTQSPPKHDPDVVCPFGFWGIKHMVEQPLSASIKLGEGDGREEGRRPSSVHSVIEYEGKPVLGVGVSLELYFVQQHVEKLQDWISKKGTFQPFEPDQTLGTVGTGLQSTPLHIYYFYCHGGESEREVWLSVGDGEYILPDHIRDEWELYKRWVRSQPPFVPLVFLNGCGTLSLSPESIAEFLHEFTFAGAAGVIGTEISVDERLAQEVGIRFLQAFAGWQEAGRIIQELRHWLLLKNNPLGLVYTPYCYAELHLEPR